MILHQGQQKHWIKALLDTGCAIALINQKTIEQLGIQQTKRKNPIQIENYMGEVVEGAGQWCTEPMRLQHQNHYTRERFEISPMDPEIDVFLPFGWITQHPLQGAWTSEEVHFNSAGCEKRCTKYETNDFSITWDGSVATDPVAKTIGYVAAVTNSDEDLLGKVPREFHQYLDVMSTEIADVLPKHRSYDCKIDLKEGSTAPCGPIYPLSEIELQTLREWLKEMERMGKIKRSTSPAGSPI